LPLPLILQPSDFGPHIVTSLLLDTTSVPQPAEITQFIFGQPLMENPACVTCHRKH
jgi:hypothetical protein